MCSIIIFGAAFESNSKTLLLEPKCKMSERHRNIFFSSNQTFISDAHCKISGVVVQNPRLRKEFQTFDTRGDEYQQQNWYDVFVWWYVGVTMLAAAAAFDRKPTLPWGGANQGRLVCVHSPRLSNER